ncbi:thiol:disulfide interchange protein DsbA/DsbL [Spartinivicinus poritis]|uniref:Thiol:disulfide interchange protein n=1 Tax=Spartinivicinus poritis TaxID=2994640 RepID=A0ABT5UBN0_9GAMM|nr:thiol:disulfide interchange protein DsbA/DsbL [Spartinivicinus sp. A2-2]MDE1463590.1 thiol:disulfide interchange protein DsbA/DsbL [Spartinivicinus sp. A2-2]
MVKKFSRAFVLLVAMPLAAVAAQFEEGKHYVKLPEPVPTVDPAKIEVAELFWYGCPHCYKLEPLVKPWSAKLPDDVEFVKIPATFGGLWNKHAQLFYTIEALKLDDKAHDAVFAAFHTNNNKLDTPEKMAKLLAKLGVEEEKFMKQYKSFGVANQLRLASSKGRGYRATGVPAIIINGKYRTGAAMAGGEKQMLEVAEYLVEQERKLSSAASQSGTDQQEQEKSAESVAAE